VPGRKLAIQQCLQSSSGAGGEKSRLIIPEIVVNFLGLVAPAHELGGFVAFSGFADGSLSRFVAEAIAPEIPRGAAGTVANEANHRQQTDSGES
jgi:hypothetical protein